MSTMEEDERINYDKAVMEHRLREYPMLEGKLLPPVYRPDLTRIQAQPTWTMRAPRCTRNPLSNAFPPT